VIVCIGNPVYDLIHTPYISTNGRVLSGCSTNACLALAKLGEQTVMVGNVGGDFRGQLTKEIGAYGIKSYIKVSKETGGFKLIYDKRGNRTLEVLGIADPIREVPNWLTKADWVLFGPVMGEIGLDLVRRAREKTGAPFFLDPQGIVRQLNGQGLVTLYFNPDLWQIIPFFEVVKANEQEANIITGIDPRRDPYAAVLEMHKYGCRVAIVTLAEEGSIIYDGNKFYRIPAYPTVAVDPTGAGDVYAAGFMYRYIRNGGDLLDAGCFASCAASIMVEHCGPAFPLKLIEIERRMQKLMERMGNGNF